MVHRLVPRPDMPGVHPGHGLDTLPVPGQPQPGDVRAPRLMPIAMTKHAGEALHTGGELLAPSRLQGAHTTRLPADPINHLAFLTQSYYALAIFTCRLRTTQSSTFQLLLQ